MKRVKRLLQKWDEEESYVNIQHDCHGNSEVSCLDRLARKNRKWKAYNEIIGSEKRTPFYLLQTQDLPRNIDPRIITAIQRYNTPQVILQHQFDPDSLQYKHIKPLRHLFVNEPGITQFLFPKVTHDRVRKAFVEFPTLLQNVESGRPGSDRPDTTSTSRIPTTEVDTRGSDIKGVSGTLSSKEDSESIHHNKSGNTNNN
jgi:hypothetical protein